MAHELRGGEGVLVFHGDDLVIDRGVEHVGHEACADALDLVGARGALRKDRRACGLHGHDLHSGLLLLEVGAHSRHGAARAHAGHEHVDLAVGVLPDLGAGRGLVHGGVGRVHELAGDDRSGNLGLELLGLGDGSLHAGCAVGEHELCAVAAHELAALDAHGLGHRDDDAVATGGGDAGQADAGVARGGLDDGAAGLQLAGGFGCVNHGLGHAVLHRAAGVEVLELHKHARLQAELLLDVGELEQGGVADGLIDAGVDVRHGGSLLLGRWRVGVFQVNLLRL